MRDLHRPTLPVARLLVVVLGVFGFVAGPTGSGTQAGASSTGTISAVRAWVVQHTSPRGRTSAKTRPGGRAESTTTTTTATTAAARQAVAAAELDAPPAPAALPVSGAEVGPPSPRAVRPPAGALTAPEFAASGAPRGRAPPPSARL